MRNGILNSFRKSALGLHQYECLFWSKNMQKSAKNQCFSNTEINNREGDGMGYTIYIICISSYERHMEISVGRNNL